MLVHDDLMSLPKWYPVLHAYTFPTSFVTLTDEQLAILRRDDSADCISYPAIKELLATMRNELEDISGNCFAGVDCCSPTDTDRFRDKRGATYSANSTLLNLMHSDKVREAIREGKVTSICLRPFRRMQPAREFRLFITCGELVAMSQYHLTRHFRRLAGAREKYWNLAYDFVKVVRNLLPDENIVMDIYVSATGTIYIVDFNPWGEPTDPKMLIRWDRDWSKEIGIVLMEPPLPLSGDVNVSF
ncbi:MAG: cell division cycle 123 family protein [Victivallaceae bacterium]|nr:cell division cycle 123 family protein [Victivallaceae bacterium]